MGKTLELNESHEKEIISCAKKGHLEAMKLLLDADRSLVNARDSDGSTPLHCASWKGHDELVTLLLDCGADINSRNENDHWGDTPLHAAAHGNRRAVAAILIERGADLVALNPKGKTPLEETEAHKATAVAKLLRAELAL